MQSSYEAAISARRERRKTLIMQFNILGFWVRVYEYFWPASKTTTDESGPVLGRIQKAARAIFVSRTGAPGHGG